MQDSGDLSRVSLVVVKGALQDSLRDHWLALLQQVGGELRTSVLDLDTMPVELPTHGPVVVLFPTPYMEHYPAQLQALPPSVRVAYVGYGLPDISKWESGHFGLEFFQKVDFLMCSSTTEMNSFIDHGVSPSRTRLTGNPLLSECLSLPAANVSSQRTLLWAPHWTREWADGSPGFSNWHLTVHDLLACLADSSELSVVVRPHGFLALSDTEGLPKYASDLWSGPEYASSREAFAELVRHPRVIVSDASLPDDLLRCSDVITDGVSIIGYAPAAGRRTALVRRDDSPTLGRTGERLCQALDLVAPGTRTRDWVAAGFSNEADLTARSSDDMRAVVTSVYSAPFDTSPGRRLVDWINESRVA